MLLLLFLTILGLSNASLINKIDNDECDPPPMPTYSPDAAYGTYCRFHGAYSQLDIVFLVDIVRSIGTVTQAYKIFGNSLHFPNEVYGNDSTVNRVAFVAFSDHGQLKIPFGVIQDSDGLTNAFNQVPAWSNAPNNGITDFEAALKYVDETVYDYENGRGKLIVLTTDNTKQWNQVWTDGLKNATNSLKSKGVKIFIVGYSAESTYFHNNTIFPLIVTEGWYHFLLIDNSDINSNLTKDYINYARQANCICLRNTVQFSTLVPTNNPNIGPYQRQIYSDCFFSYEGIDGGDIPGNFTEAGNLCNANISVNARSVAVNSSVKWEFFKDYLQARNERYILWSGFNGSMWLPYNGSDTSVHFLPIEYYDPAIQEICQNVYKILPGNGSNAAFVQHGGTTIFCKSDPHNKFIPTCESKAVDALNNPRLCNGGPFINADARPSQVGKACSTNIVNAWLDIVFVVDVSANVGKAQLEAATNALLTTLEKLNFKKGPVPFSSRISLITFASHPKLQFNLNEITNSSMLKEKFKLEKYSNPKDAKQNADAAFQLARSEISKRKSFRRPLIVFLSAGFKKANDPSKEAEKMKSKFNAAIITINATSFSLDNLASFGLNVSLDQSLSAAFKKSLSYGNCYCLNAKTQQLIINNNGQIEYFRECLIGFDKAETPAAAFKACAKLNGIPVAVTNKIKADFIFNSSIMQQINYSPVFTIGLQRNPTFPTQHIWAEFGQNGYPYGTYPAVISSLDNVSNNCSYGLQLNDNIVAVPANCNSIKLPYICQINAVDFDHDVV